MGLILERRMK
jgi:hypothetical protein